MVRHHGLGEETGAELRRRSLPSIRIVPDENGTSRLGGEPDLPNGVDWPVADSGPLTFYAQIDLGAAAGLDAAGARGAAGRRRRPRVAPRCLLPGGACPARAVALDRPRALPRNHPRRRR